MFAFAVVKQLDIVKDIAPGFIPCHVSFHFDPLSLEQLKKTLCDRVVMTIASTAHASFQTVGFQEVLPIMAAVLAALIGVNQHWPTRFASPHGHQERIQDKVLGDPGLH